MAVRIIDREQRVQAALLALDQSRSHSARAPEILTQRGRRDRRIMRFDSTRAAAVFATVDALVTGQGVNGAANAAGGVYYSGGKPACAWDEAWLPSGKRIGDAAVGDDLLVLAKGGEIYTPYEVKAIRASVQPCVRLVSQSGVTLTCSTSTPITARVRRKLAVLNIFDSVGATVRVLDADGFRWERIESLTEVGDLPVRLLSCDDATYAAGDDPNRFMFTHNAKTALD